MLLIRVYPFVFIDHIENKVILYNTMASLFRIYDIEDGICVFNKSTFSMKFTLANCNVAREIKQSNLGLYDEVSSLQKFYLSDISTEISDSLAELSCKSAYDAKDLVKRLVISLSPTLDVFSGAEKVIKKSNSYFCDVDFYSSFTRLTSLSCLLIYIDKKVVLSFPKFYAKFLRNYRVEIAVPLQDYLYMPKIRSHII